MHFKSRSFFVEPLLCLNFVIMKRARSGAGGFDAWDQSSKAARSDVLDLSMVSDSSDDDSSVDANLSSSEAGGPQSAQLINKRHIKEFVYEETVNIKPRTEFPPRYFSAVEVADGVFPSNRLFDVPSPAQLMPGKSYTIPRDVLTAAYASEEGVALRLTNAEGTAMPLGRAVRDMPAKTTNQESPQKLWQDLQISAAKSLGNPLNDAWWFSPWRVGVLEVPMQKAAWHAVSECDGFPERLPRLNKLEPTHYFPSITLLQQLVQLQEDRNLSFSAPEDDVQLALQLLQLRKESYDSGLHRLLKGAIKNMKQTFKDSSNPRETGWVAYGQLQGLGDRLVLSLADQRVYAECFPDHQNLTSISRCLHALLTFILPPRPSAQSRRVLGEWGMEVLALAVQHAQRHEPPTPPTLSRIVSQGASQLSILSMGDHQFEAPAGAALGQHCAPPLVKLSDALRSAQQSRRSIELELTQSSQAARPKGKQAKKHKAGGAKRGGAPESESLGADSPKALCPIVWRLVDCGSHFVVQADIIQQLCTSDVPASLAVRMRRDSGRLSTPNGQYVPPRLPQRDDFNGFMDTRSDKQLELVTSLAVDPIHGVYQVQLADCQPALRTLVTPVPPSAQHSMLSTSSTDFLVLDPVPADESFFDSMFLALRRACAAPMEQRERLPAPFLPISPGTSYESFKRGRLLKYKHELMMQKQPKLTEAGATRADYDAAVAETERLVREHRAKQDELDRKRKAMEQRYLEAPQLESVIDGTDLWLTGMAVCSMDSVRPESFCLAVVKTKATTERLKGVSKDDRLYLLAHKSVLKHGQTNFRVLPSLLKARFFVRDPYLSHESAMSLDEVITDFRVFDCRLSDFILHHKTQVFFSAIKGADPFVDSREFSDHDLSQSCMSMLSSKRVFGVHDSFLARMKISVGRRVTYQVAELVKATCQQALVDAEFEAARAAGFKVSAETAVRVVPDRLLDRELAVLGLEQPETAAEYFRERSIDRYFRRTGYYMRESSISTKYPSPVWIPVTAPAKWKVSTQGLLDLVEHNNIYDNPGYLQFDTAPAGGSSQQEGALICRLAERRGGDIDCEWVQPPGLDASLFAYQRKTVAWMVQQEELPMGMATYVYRQIPLGGSACAYLDPEGTMRYNAPLQARGGAIFSTMGTGKTVMTLALIMSRPRHPDDCDLSFGDFREQAWVAACDRQRGAPKYRGAATELLNVKAASHVGAFAPKRFRGRATLIVAPVSLVGQWASEIRKHTPGARVVLWHGDTRTQANLSNILTSDVVLTTYELLASCSALFSLIDWHRVVFDESQRMKNASIKLVWFAQRISAQRRWLLSGTPISHTGLKDLAGQLAALHAPDCFWEVDCLDKEAAEQAQLHTAPTRSRHALHHTWKASSLGISSYKAACFALWWRCVARRQTVQGLIERGEISLPESTEETLIIPFSSLSEEEQLVYKAIRSVVLKTFQRVQLVGRMRGLSTAYIRSLSLLRRLRMAIGDVISVLNSATDVVDEEQEAADESSAAMSSASPSGATPAEQLASFIKTNLRGGDADTALERILSTCGEDCIICFCPITELSVLPCLHLVCKDCWKQLLSCSGGRSADCPMCRSTAKNGQAVIFDQAKTLELLSNGEAEVEDTSPAAAAAMSTVAEAIAVLKTKQHSTKTAFAVRHIQDTLRRDPESKIIVFSQFTKTVHSMVNALRRAGVRSCLITGATSMNARTEQLHEFAHDPSTRVFVLSIRSAGVGLNLTAANHVLFMEPNENIALVSQAVSRVLRLGQKKIVQVAHLQVDDSVEVDIAAWAERIRATQGIRADTKEGEHVSELAQVASMRNRELPASATLVQGASKESKSRLVQRWEDISTIFASIAKREAHSSDKK